ncbi:MAG: response regulator [Lentimicrobiaceae bacterium]|nr:response regulator [Lentimicrobiaceae bacterium]MCB9024310.1 response regulator [Lentimicrobiaceae bacterium]
MKNKDKSYSGKNTDSPVSGTHHNKKDEESAAVTEDVFIHSFDVLPAALLLVDTEFCILRCNKAAAELLALTDDDKAGKPVWDILQFRDEMDSEKLQHLLSSSPSLVTYVRSLPSQQYLHCSVIRLTVAQGMHYLIQLQPVSAQEIDSLTVAGTLDEGISTEKVFLNTGISDETNFGFGNAFLRNIIDSLPHPFYVIESGTHQARLKNLAALQFEDKLAAVHCFMKEKPEGCVGNAYVCALKMVVESTSPVRIEHEFLLQSGERRIYEVFGYPVFNNKGVLKFIIQYSIDITERKRNEIELLDYKNVLDNLMSNLPGMAFRCLNEVNWTMEYVSPGCKRLTGYSPKELISNKKTHYGDLIYHEDRKKVWDSIQRAVKIHKFYRVEYRIVTKNGKIKWVLEQGKGFFDKYDKLVSLEGLVTDITEGKNAELLLKDELAINQGIAAIGVELLKDSIKPARVAYMVQHYTRIITGSQFSLLISPSNEDETSYMYCFEDKDEVDVAKRIRRSDKQMKMVNNLINELLTKQTPVIMNEPGIKILIPCVLPGEFNFNRLMCVPAFINSQFAGILILADAENEYTMHTVNIVQRFVNMFALAAYKLRAEESLQAAKEKAEESDRLKSLFLSNMSHELRTPMNAIVGFAEMLQDTELSIDEKDRFLDVIIKSGDNLLRIVNDIIDISKIEAGQLKIIYSDCYLNELFSDLEVFFNHELVRMKKEHLTLYMQPGTSDQNFAIYTDTVRIRQIISNLVGNAMKFTDEGFIEVGYRVKKDKIDFYVRDSGIGIPVDQQKVIFERFGQVKDAGSRNLAGTGLGLTISKNLAELLGGSMWLDSYPGEGSTFWFSIPFKPGRHQSDPHSEPGYTLAPAEDLSGKCILVVEDVDTNFFYISSLLKKKNCRVLRASNGLKAVEICKSDSSVNLVLMDIELPLMDGYEATRQIKKIRPDLPIIAQTAFALMGERERSVEAGCDDYIAKPIKKEILIEAIARLI